MERWRASCGKTVDMPTSSRVSGWRGVVPRLGAVKPSAASSLQDPDPRYTWSNAAHVFLMQERERAALYVLRRHGCLPLAGKPVLEVGCGSGTWLRDLIRWGSQPEDLTGIDVRAEKIAEARRLCPAGVRLECCNAAHLPWDNSTFALVLQATMLTSVLDPQVRHEIAAEMRRVLKPGGRIFWYDFHVNNPRNSKVRGITQREIRALFPDCILHLRRVTLAPPVARWLVPRARLVATLVGAVPLLRTHYLGVLSPKT